MASNYSANQYEKAFSPRFLQNWSPAKPTKQGISSHEGYTQIIANDHGHLLPSVPHSKANPWGSFMGTWQLPLKVPPARVTLTARTAAGAASLTAWIQKNPELLKASNGLCPEITGKPHGPVSQKKPRKSAQQAPSPPAPLLGAPGSNLNSPDQLRSPHPSAGHTPSRSQKPHVLTPPEALTLASTQAGPNLAEAQKYKPGVPEGTEGPQ